MQCLQLQRKCFALCSLLICWISCVHSGYVEDFPKCPFPCGDNPELLCPNRKILSPGQSEVVEFVEGLTEHDFWDIRIDQADKHTVKPTMFSVKILDSENFKGFEAGDGSYEACKDHKELNQAVSCLSVNGGFCRTRKEKVDGKYQYRNYTHVIITCENEQNSCPLEWHVGVMMMKKSSCVSLGMPCAATTALIWIFILAGLGAVLFVNRVKVMEAMGSLELSSVKWRIFSGRFSTSVEEMEARLAQRSNASDGATVEPYTRL